MHYIKLIYWDTAGEQRQQWGLKKGEKLESKVKKFNFMYTAALLL